MRLPSERKTSWATALPAGNRKARSSRSTLTSWADFSSGTSRGVGLLLIISHRETRGHALNFLWPGTPRQLGMGFHAGRAPRLFGCGKHQVSSPRKRGTSKRHARRGVLTSRNTQAAAQRFNLHGRVYWIPAGAGMTVAWVAREALSRWP